MDTQKVSYDLKDITVLDNGSILILTMTKHELQVVQVKDGSDQLTSLYKVSFQKADGF
jgi:hypothetical protein